MTIVSCSLPPFRFEAVSARHRAKQLPRKCRHLPETCAHLTAEEIMQLAITASVARYRLCKRDLRIDVDLVQISSGKDDIKTVRQ